MSVLGRRRAVAAKLSASIVSTGDDATDRALDQVARAVDANADSVYQVDVDLVVGSNRIEHGLGRAPAWIIVMPAEADALFAWAWDPTQPSNPRPALLVDLVTVGVAMRARVVIG